MAWVHRVVSNDSHSIESLLNTRVQSVGYKRFDVIVYVSAWLSQFLAEFLNSQPDQRGRTSRRNIKDRTRLIVIVADVSGHIRVRRRSFASSRIR